MTESTEPAEVRRSAVESTSGAETTVDEPGAMAASAQTPSQSSTPGMSGATLASAGMSREDYLSKPYPRIKVARRNQSDNDASFKSTLDAVQSAVARRDLDALLEHVDADRIVGTPGGDAGMAAFLTHWQLTYGPRESPLWDAMNEALSLGVGYDESRGAFFAPCLGAITPYADQILAQHIDPNDRALINGVQVNARSQPNLRGEVVGQLSFEIVKLAGEADPATRQTIAGRTEPWWPVAMPDGKPAYVFGKFVRRWNGSEARFERVGDGWKLVRFAPREP